MAKAKRLETEKEDVFSDLNRLNAMLADLDERALILSLAAFAEEALRELVQAYLMPGESTEKLLDGFNAPLGTFSARLRMADALGLLTPHQASDFDRLRKIRNEFAHNWLPVSFTDQNIASHIQALNFHALDDQFPETLGEKVRTSLSTLLLEIRVTTGQIRKRGGAVLRGQHILAGVSGDLDEQMKICRGRLIAIRDELHLAKGDRRRFLLASKHRWEGKLEIVRLNAGGRKAEVRAIQAELDAWNRGPEY